VSPAVKLSGAIVSHVTTDLDIACLPKDLPAFIEIDLSALEVGHSMHVSAVKLPPGVTVVTRGRTDPVVAAAIVPRAQVETEEETAAKEATAATAAAATEADAKAAAEKGGDKAADKKDDKKK
jgi:large subunit ribosomal protein L25